MSIASRVAEWDADAVEALMRAARHDTTAGLQTLGEVCAGALLVVVERDGEPVLRYAARPVERSGGVELLILAAAGHAPGLDLVRLGLEDVERRFPTVDAVTVQTRRLALVKKLMAHGFQYQATKLTRRVRACH